MVDNSVEFTPYPKTPRLFRDIVITEKIDGTNAAIGIRVDPVEEGTSRVTVWAQSRKRLITPDDDNFGFAKWVWEHQVDLFLTLGEGLHFGEWFGSGIQRGYGVLKGDKFFALFNVKRWAHLEQGVSVPGLACVPTLYQGPFSEDKIRETVEDLRENGSRMVDGFMNPEGVVVYHTASGQVFKVLLENDELPKGLVA